MDGSRDYKALIFMSFQFCADFTSAVKVGMRCDDMPPSAVLFGVSNSCPKSSNMSADPLKIDRAWEDFLISWLWKCELEVLIEVFWQNKRYKVVFIVSDDEVLQPAAGWGFPLPVV